MSNGLITTLTLWDSAVKLVSTDDLQKALEQLQNISQPSSKILFNIGTVFLSLRQLPKATQAFQEAIEKDAHLAVAYFQLGCALYHDKRYEESKLKFAECLACLRERSHIDYNQLGLKYKLRAREVFHNQAVASVGGRDVGKPKELLKSTTSGQEAKDNISNNPWQIDQTMSLIELGKTALFHPSRNLVTNIEKKDYLGKAKVIAGVGEYNNYSGFLGPNTKSDIIQAISLPPTPDVLRRLGGHMSTTLLDRLKKGRQKRSHSVPAVYYSPTMSAPATTKSSPTHGSPCDSTQASPAMKQRSMSVVNSISPFQLEHLVRLKLKNTTQPLEELEEPNELPASNPSLTPKEENSTSPPPLPPRVFINGMPVESNLQQTDWTDQSFQKVLLTLHSHVSQKLIVDFGLTLDMLNDKAAKLFAIDHCTFHLWSKTKDGDSYRISSEEIMQQIWNELDRDMLSLYCYSAV